MVVFFVFWIAACTPKEADELTTEPVKVVSADRYPLNNSLFTICSDSDTYFISSTPNKGEASVSEMEKEIFPGDILSITYYKHLGRYQIVDLRSDTKVYRSVDKMNDKPQDRDDYFIYIYRYSGACVYFISNILHQTFS